MSTTTIFLICDDVARLILKTKKVRIFDHCDFYLSYVIMHYWKCAELIALNDSIASS